MNDKLLSACAVREIVGGISLATLWRWSNDPAMGFPPALKLRGRNYWSESAIVEWLETRRQAHQAKAA
ncbi:helix-turn-helix transcriptional regulator [Oceanibaculum sp.]|uniref:helix-turn-helix transcriptional regulator n=1 Tax=Oceanibaculum sp. TaxID=1903597 RepID=UPI00259111CA|nr:hypothetical protein [Oceanibaculum sp.]MCH2393224.1 hypothetical protein [Oceanibaculum sp.]